MTIDGDRVQGLSAEDFRRGMRRLTGAVNVISTCHSDETHAMLATAVCSVSADPPTLLVCVNRTATACAPIAASGRFCVSVLGEDQHSLAEQFLTVDSRRRLDLCRWQELATGAPAIDGALVNFDCEVSQEVHAGTHTIFLGRIVAAAVPEVDTAPLLYFDGRYAGVAPPLYPPAP